MGAYPENHPDIKMFRDYLTEMDRPQVAKMIAKDISKFLYYANKDEVDWWKLIERKTVYDYFETLKDDKLGLRGG